MTGIINGEPSNQLIDTNLVVTRPPLQTKQRLDVGPKMTVPIRSVPLAG